MIRFVSTPEKAISDIPLKETTIVNRLNQLEKKLDRVPSSFTNEAEETMVIMNRDSQKECNNSLF